jgi:diguanylate cyclase (GGDEF)-like protein
MKRQSVPSYTELVARNRRSTEYFDALGEADRKIHAADALARRLVSAEVSLAEAEAQALTNPVSGLPNRLAFDKTLAERIAANDCIAVAILDLTKFKNVNDTLGHTTGDVVLRSAGRIIADSTMLAHETRDSDFVCHLSGDEYGIIFDMAPRRDATLNPAARVNAIQERITTAIEDYSTTTLPDGLDIAVAMGIAVRHPGQTAEDLFNAADSAMYEHKIEQHQKLGTVPR